MTSKATVTYLESNEMQKARAFSPAVITEGGRTVWLAGQTTTTDLDGHDISGQFEAQCRACFAMIDKTYADAYAALPGVTLKRIDDSRHFIMLDQPKAFAEAVSALELLVAEAAKYYEQGDYKDDKFKKGEELHPQMMDGYARFRACARSLRGTPAEVRRG